MQSFVTPPPGATGVLVLADGRLFWGQGVGAPGAAVGEVCFNTGMTGYQEILTDPSYAAQIVTFTFPHIGNVGTNGDDCESARPAARGLILREAITPPANWRAEAGLDRWLRLQGLVGLAGVDTRALTSIIRDEGAPNGVVAHEPSGHFDLPALQKMAQEWPGLTGMDLARTVSCSAPYEWNEGAWDFSAAAYAPAPPANWHVVAVDYGAKRNILRLLAAHGCRVTVVPATTDAAMIMALRPDGVFLSNGPGDPAATASYAVPMIRQLLATAVPIFGICLGHQLLALALGGQTQKMARGHRGANHPVLELASGRVEITSQNHGFEVLADSLPAQARVTHHSLFDGSNEGLALEDRPVFSVQYHPEASPGPGDSHYLFERFVRLMENRRRAAA